MCSLTKCYKNYVSEILLTTLCMVWESEYFIMINRINHLNLKQMCLFQLCCNDDAELELSVS